MADVEDDAEMDSNFLDSMLEVEMTEEDVELDVSKNEDPLDVNCRSLPPVPMFDLQSETLSFKEVYRNSLQPTPIVPLPRVHAVNSAIQINVGPKQRAILALQPRDLPTKNIQVPIKPNSTLPKILPKPPQKAPPKPTVRNGGLSEEELASQFLKKVFKPEYIKNVFTKKDPPQDISQVSKEEMDYFKECFKDLSKVQYCRLHCTICDRHLGCGVNVEKRVTVHKMLKVLTCKQCFEFYGDGNFPCDKGDNCEIYCRWCGQGGALVCCSFCPRVFCKKCVRQNFGAPFLRSIQGSSDWACFCCAQKPLWPHRAICRALMRYIAQLKLDPKATQNDTSKCCNSGVVNKKKVIKPVEKNNIPQGQFTVTATSAQSSPVPFFTGNSVVPVTSISGKPAPVLKSNVQIKVGDQNKIPQKAPNVFNKAVKSNILPSGSLISGNNLLRNFTSSTPLKNYSGLPQLIKSPVLHGETVITPPVSKRVAQKKPPPNANLNTNIPSDVKVSVVFPGPHVDTSNVPVVRVPHNVQGMVLRIIFPNNRVHFVRLFGDKTDCKAAKEFPMPEFKTLDELTFVEENLANAFKLPKMMFDKLHYTKDKVDSRTNSTEESIFTSSVQKLHSLYEKSIELLKELDNSLLENFEIWKNQAKNSVDVIDISDEDSKTGSDRKKFIKRSNFLEKYKELIDSDDSDVEILDVEMDEKKENVNKKEKCKNSNALENYSKIATMNSNFLENWSSSSERSILNSSVTIKRRRAPVKNNKRLKVDDSGEKNDTVDSKIVNSNVRRPKKVNEASSQKEKKEFEGNSKEYKNEEENGVETTSVEDGAKNPLEEENDEKCIEENENDAKKSFPGENEFKKCPDEENHITDSVDEENDLRESMEEENEVKEFGDEANGTRDSTNEENGVKDFEEEENEMKNFTDEENNEKDSGEEENNEKYSAGEENNEKESEDEENNEKDYVNEENHEKRSADEESSEKDSADEDNDVSEPMNNENNEKQCIGEENDVKESVNEDEDMEGSAEENVDDNEGGGKNSLNRQRLEGSEPEVSSDAEKMEY